MVRVGHVWSMGRAASVLMLVTGGTRVVVEDPTTAGFSGVKLVMIELGNVVRG